MRILQVTSGYAPETGGVEQHVAELSSALRDAGQHVTIAAASGAAGAPHYEQRDGLTIRRFRAHGPTTYRVAPTLLPYLLRHRTAFDVIHAHNIHALPLISAVVAASTRVVVTPHYHGRGHSRLASLLHHGYTPLARAALRHAGAVVCDSAGEADLVAARLGVPRDQITIVPSIIERAGIVQTGRVPGAAPGGTLLAVGRLAAHKRLDRLITALPHLPPHIRLEVVGAGPERERLDWLVAQCGLQERVAFRGRVADDALEAAYRAADVVVTLSEAEAFGRTVIEALSYGCRVVCSDIASFRGFAAAHPALVHPVPLDAPPAAIAAQITTALAAAAPACVDLRAYSSATVAARMHDIYRRVAEYPRTQNRMTERQVNSGHHPA